MNSFLFFLRPLFLILCLLPVYSQSCPYSRHNKFTSATMPMRNFMPRQKVNLRTMVHIFPFSRPSKELGQISYLSDFYVMTNIIEQFAELLSHTFCLFRGPLAWRSLFACRVLIFMLRRKLNLLLPKLKI